MVVYCESVARHAVEGAHNVERCRGTCARCINFGNGAKKTDVCTAAVDSTSEGSLLYTQL